MSGPTGTTGFVDVAIAKTLISSVADLKVYLDGASLNYAAASTPDSWQLHFTYDHSIHSVIVSLGNTVVPEPPESGPFPTLLVIAASGAAVVMALIFLIIRRSRKTRAQN